MHPPLPFWPREHGATVQLMLAVSAGLAMGPGHVGGYAQAVLTVVLYMASVPFTHLLSRGSQVSLARRRLVWYALVLLPLGALTWIHQPLVHGLHLLVAILPAAAMVPSLCRGRSRSLQVALLAGLTFAAGAHLIALLNGSSPVKASLLGALLAAAYLLGTLSVQTLQKPCPSKRWRPWTWFPPLITLALMALVEDLHQAQILSERLAGSLIPTGVSTLVFTCWKPTRFRQVGWILTAGALGTAIWAVAVLR